MALTRAGELPLASNLAQRRDIVAGELFALTLCVVLSLSH